MTTRLFAIVLCIGAVRALAAQDVSPVAVHRHAARMTALSSPARLAVPKTLDDGQGPLYVAVGALLGAGTAAYVIFHGAHWSDDGMVIPVMPFAEIGAAGIVGGLVGWAIHSAKGQ